MSREISVNAKNNLAKLLAKENINVLFKPVETPYFEINTRTLVLPIIKNLPESIIDRYIGHEVSHAIYTPIKEWNALAASQKPEDRLFLQFVNIVEDVRIEKFILNVYPGLYRDFVKSVSDFVKHKPIDYNPTIFADKVNVHFKYNIYDKVYDLKFNDKENDYIARLAKVETWNEVISLARELMDISKQQAPEEWDKIMNSMAEKSGQPSKEELEGALNKLLKSLGDYDKFIKSNTDKNKDIYGQTIETQNVFFDGSEHTKLEFDNKIYGYDKILQEFRNIAKCITTESTAWEEFRKLTKLYIPGLISEFLRKKSAAMFLSKQKDISGELDLNNLFKYKYSDEVFKSLIRVKKGKNHTFIIVVDFSQSMSMVINSVIKQLYLLVLFARRIGVKYVVYAFNDTNHSSFGSRYKTSNRNIMNFANAFTLNELFNSNMSEKEFEEMGKYLYMNTNHNSPMYNKHTRLHLGGTPLNDSVYMMNYIVPLVKKEHKSDIINCMFLTDGDSNSSYFFNADRHNQDVIRRANSLILESNVTKKSYIVNSSDRYGDNNYKITLSMINFIKHEYGVKVINFHLVDSHNHRTYINRYVGSRKEDDYTKAYGEHKMVHILKKDTDVWDGVFVADYKSLYLKNKFDKKTLLLLQSMVDIIA